MPGLRAVGMHLVSVVSAFALSNELACLLPLPLPTKGTQDQHIPFA